MSSITKWKEGGLDYSIFKALFNNKWMISFYFKQDQIDITQPEGALNQYKNDSNKKGANNY